MGDSTGKMFMIERKEMEKTDAFYDLKATRDKVYGGCNLVPDIYRRNAFLPVCIIKTLKKVAFIWVLRP